MHDVLQFFEVRKGNYSDTLFSLEVFIDPLNYFDGK